MTSVLEDVRRALAALYDIERELGRGGMATVYLARHLASAERVAVKVLEPDLAGSVGHERFLREIRIASTLRHPGILTVQDSGEADGLLYYVMPYVDGESLRARMDRERQLPIDEALTIAIEVATALHDAHAQGFVHRDIKPDNIMLSGGQALVADFGIARAIDQAGTEKLTETGLAVGTPTYMSPEQWTGDKVDGRSDLYALGCVTFEMLVGEPPFTGPTPQVILARHSMQEVPSLRVARSTISPELEEAVRRSMAKVPSDRFASAGEFAAALGQAPRRASDSSSPALTPAALPARTTGGEGFASGGFGRASTGEGAAPAHSGTTRGHGRWLAVVAAAIVLALAGFLGYRGFAGPSEADLSRIVVLPFRNVGAAEDEYFSDGITEEITTRLSSVSSLGVIARTSAIQYRETNKTVDQIGKELGVGHLVEGSVRWDRSASGRPGVRITVRLIRVSDGTQVWANDMTFELAQVFEVQASVAEKVVQALNVVLIDRERVRLAARPTENMTAYDFYLRGNAHYNRSWERADVDSALLMYQRAAEADGSFALAWAQLGKAHVWKHRLGFDETPERLALSRAAIDSAMALDPNLPESHIARGLYHYWGEWDYEKAIDELTIARTLQPSNAWVYLQLGNIRRRQGEWIAAVREYERAGEFDPRFHIIWFNIGHLRLHVRQYDAAETYLDRALLLQPNFLDAHLLKMGLYIGATGDTARARAWFDSTRKVVPPDRWRLLTGHWLLGPARVLFPKGADRLALIAPGLYGLDSSLALLSRAEALRDMGDAEGSRATTDSAVIALEERFRQTPTIPWISGALGVAYALQGRSTEGVTAAKRAEALMSDALDGPGWIINEARVQLLVGDRKAAMDALELALKIPSGLSVHWLRLDPAWAPLRGDPRFEALIARGSPAPPTG